MYMLTLTLTLLCVCWSTGASLIQGAPPPLTDVLGAVPTGHSGDWAVEVQQGQERAREVAQKFGLYFVGQVMCRTCIVVLDLKQSLEVY